MKAILIDNYDSFTYNLKALIEQAGVDVEVIRNDKMKLEELEDYDLIFISPGPGVPDEAGQLKAIIDRYKTDKPILGICLGMQAIAEVFGGKLKLLAKPLHGIGRKVNHSQDAIFQGIANGFLAARYHSWIVDTEELPTELKVIAESDEGEIMGVKHNVYPIYGFQFHPESVLTDTGIMLIRNFIEHQKTTTSEKIIRETV